MKRGSIYEKNASPFSVLYTKSNSDCVTHGTQAISVINPKDYTMPFSFGIIITKSESDWVSHAIAIVDPKASINNNIDNVTLNSTVKKRPLENPFFDPASVIPKKKKKPCLDHLPPNERYRPRTTNVVATVRVGVHKLNLEYIETKWKNSTYKKNKNGKRRKKSPALTVKIMNVTGMLYASGKLTVVGAKSIENAHRGAKKIQRKLIKLGYDTIFEDFKVVNYVMTVELDFSISLGKFAEKYCKWCYYEPERFPGATCKITNPTEMTCEVFVSGKINMLGAKSKEACEKGFFDYLFPKLLKFKK